MDGTMLAVACFLSAECTVMRHVAQHRRHAVPTKHSSTSMAGIAEHAHWCLACSCAAPWPRSTR